jgi:hypothetical protein
MVKPKQPFDFYRICESILISNVEEKVSELMAEGWTPHGNLVVTHKSENSDGNQSEHYAQAMVRLPEKRRMPGNSG